MIEKSIINLYEHLKSESKFGPLPLPPEDLEFLRKHRHIRSHPANYKFSDEEVDKFFQERGHYKDPVAIRIVKLRAPVIRRLAELGSKIPTIPLDVVAQGGTTMVIREILTSVLNPGVQIALSNQEIEDHFQKYKDAILNKAGISAGIAD